MTVIYIPYKLASYNYLFSCVIMFLFIVLYMAIGVICDSNSITSNTKMKDSTKAINRDMPDNLQDYEDYKNKTFLKSSSNNTALDDDDVVAGYRRLDSYSDLDLSVKEKYTEVFDNNKKTADAKAAAIANKDDKLDDGDEKIDKGDDKIDNEGDDKINNAGDIEKDGAIDKKIARTDGKEEDKPADTPDKEDTNSQLRSMFDRYKVTINDDDPNDRLLRLKNMTAGNQSLAEWARNQPEMMEQSSGSAEVKMRAGPGRSQKHIPSAIELDMAPARGGAVHTLRAKNRLCHRHVMIPEGPKYDSHGKLYLGAFERTKGKEYQQTAPPKILLPKCCNCCRKSVLGCE